MRHLLSLATAVALSLGAASAGLAQNGPAVTCGKAPGVCQQSTQGAQNSHGPAKGHATEKRPVVVQKAPVHQTSAPRIGDSGRHGQRFERHANSRFAAPPRGQEYRVVDGNLVRVDSKTLRIVAVVGLLSALLN